MTKTVIAGALGECVHVAGVSSFLRLAELAGWRTVFLGPAVSIDDFIAAARREQADLVGVSYRLTPETGERLLGEFAEAADELRAAGVRFAFGGTPPVAERARASGFFEAVFDGSQPDEAVLAYLKAGLRQAQGPAGLRQAQGPTGLRQAQGPTGLRQAQGPTFDDVNGSTDMNGSTRTPPQSKGTPKGGDHPQRDGMEPVPYKDIPQTTIERRRWKAPYPLLRHHFGLPTMADTLAGVRQIAEARALDVISLGIDQDAQENFYHPERQNPRRTGAGGVPVRSPDDYAQLYAASRTGNFPLMRTYSGTDDFIRLAEMYTETIHNAWCAIPLFWFNQMDGRGPWDLAGSIAEHQRVMSWYGERGIPVELNEPHHWGMRDAPDVVYAASAYLAAYNAKAAGVTDYIAQLMFNSPAGLSDAMDLAKMLAILEMIAPLAGPDFRIWEQTRTGLLSYPLDPAAARAHLAASIYLQMALRPDIVHIVGYTEADHAASAAEVIESAGMARRVIETVLRGAPDLTADPHVQARKRHLMAETRVTITAIRRLGDADGADPLTDPAVLARAVTDGILDAPQLGSNKFARGTVRTQIIGGACLAVDESGTPLPEAQRIERLYEIKE